MSSMLTYHEMRLVKATIPKLREQGERITTLMYGSMLKDHPELNNMFNTVNQVRQHPSLAPFCISVERGRHRQKAST